MQTAKQTPEQSAAFMKVVSLETRKFPRTWLDSIEVDISNDDYKRRYRQKVSGAGLRPIR
jgi:hypothetical protein